jgi:hypothetical protein
MRARLSEYEAPAAPFLTGDQIFGRILDHACLEVVRNQRKRFEGQSGERPERLGQCIHAMGVEIHPPANRCPVSLDEKSEYVIVFQ